MNESCERLLLGLYDQSGTGQEGTYWSWFHPDLSSAKLNRFYYEIIAPHRATVDGRDLLNARVGGAGTIDSDWVGAYRFFDGGRDKQGRQGRVVVACAFFRRVGDQWVDWEEVLAAPHFREIERIAPSCCPVPAPVELELTVSAKGASFNRCLFSRIPVRLTDRKVRSWFFDSASSAPLNLPWRGEWCESDETAEAVLLPLNSTIPPDTISAPIQRILPNPAVVPTGSDTQPKSKSRRWLIVVTFLIWAAVALVVFLKWFQDGDTLLPAPESGRHDPRYFESTEDTPAKNSNDNPNAPAEKSGLQGNGDQSSGQTSGHTGNKRNGPK